jgi:hypothetical protein
MHGMARTGKQLGIFHWTMGRVRQQLAIQGQRQKRAALIHFHIVGPSYNPSANSITHGFEAY